jgi:Ca2+-binding EF-hand superfamily protein
MRTLFATFAGLVAIALASPAFAQQGPMTPEQREARFDAGDLDKDGKLSKDEWVAQLPEPARERADQLWGRLDADGDGFVTKEQFMALRMGPAPPQPQ